MYGLSNQIRHYFVSVFIHLTTFLTNQKSGPQKEIYFSLLARHTVVVGEEGTHLQLIRGQIVKAAFSVKEK